ncbi:MAG TPA: helix-turn-helix transcriptional regulator, partial [Mucilaginibacter sp.]
TQAGPVEQMLLEVFNKYIRQSKSKKAPEWTRELKEMIQDQLDTNMALSLQQVSSELEINPAYLSREFSKYFDNLSFGDYIRKLRIEKAINLMDTTPYSLTEIAYLTGFSDQSHFNRIFKKQMGMTASEYRKKLLKK